MLLGESPLSQHKPHGQLEINGTQIPQEPTQVKTLAQLEPDS